MKARYLIDVHRWYPDKPHPAVYTNPVHAGLSIDLHYDLYMRVKQAKGKLGVISTFAPGQGIKWKVVKPGDYIVGKRSFLVLTPTEFNEQFELVPGS